LRRGAWKGLLVALAGGSLAALLAAGAVPGVAARAVAGGSTGHSVPSGFQPQSVTFIGVNKGWVVGTAPCRAAPCTSVIRTVDGGRTWRRIPAPSAPLALTGERTGVRELRFADPRDGWAFGPDLYATHDGGASWHKLLLPGSVSDLESADGVAYAAVVGTRGRVRLYRSPAGHDTWSLAAGVPRNLVAATGQIILNGRAGWLIIGDRRLFSTTTGARWHQLASPCPHESLLSLAAHSDKQVSLLCSVNGGMGMSDKTVYFSHDGGRVFVRAARAPDLGTTGSLARPDLAMVFLATSAGGHPDSFIYISPNGGRTWGVALSGGAAGKPWNDFAFPTPAQGVVISGTPLTGSALLISRNGGHTWRRVRFTVG
jgi:photosystem II stability/assembly factor-like uncharacterized protein